MTEAQLQAAIIDLAGWRRWKHYHTYRSKRSVPGFPDLVLVRDRVIFAELKNATEQPTPAQKNWGIALQAAGAEYYVWRPVDWTGGLIQKVLGRTERVRMK